MSKSIIDVWEANKVKDWSVADGWVMCASWRYMTEDRSFGLNWQECLGAGKPRGAYYAQFFGLFQSSGGQAKNFVSILKKYGGVRPNDRLVIDAEVGSLSIKSIMDFAYNVENEVGIRPEIYSTASKLNNLVFRNLTSAQLDYIKSMKIWSAGYPVPDGQFYSPTQVTSVPKVYVPDQTRYGPVVSWQCCGDVPPTNVPIPGVVAGVVGGIDFSWIDANYFAWWAGASGTYIPKPIPTPKPQISSGVVVTSLPLHVRSGPGTIYNIVDSLQPNSQVQIYKTQQVGSDIWGLIDSVSSRWVAIQYQGNIFVKLG